MIQPSGKVETRRHLLWLLPLDPEPQAGAVVVVPERVGEQSGANLAQTMGIIAQVLASLATIIVVSR